MSETRIVYTDGSCLTNPGPGGWAWAEYFDVFRSGREANTTNQRMELKAVLEALRDIDDDLVIVTDSAYVVNCFEKEWHKNWTDKGIKTKDGSKVANWDLWRPILRLVLLGNNQATFQKVKGHSGDVMNDLVDRMAKEEAYHAQRNLKRGRNRR